jgi:hypothetical protein
MKTDPQEPCQHISIAHGHAGHVTICPECNVVQVVLSHLSLRFTPDTFRDVAQMLGAAQARLDHVNQASAAAAALIDGAEHTGPSLH